jgi:hypothetical protein
VAGDHSFKLTGLILILLDLAFAAMNEAQGRPPLSFIDLRPFGPAMVVVRNHDVAEQIAKSSKLFPHSLPKTPEIYGHMVHVIGSKSILAAHVRVRNKSFYFLFSNHDCQLTIKTL